LSKALTKFKGLKIGPNFVQKVGIGAIIERRLFLALQKKANTKH